MYLLISANEVKCVHVYLMYFRKSWE